MKKNWKYYLLTLICIVGMVILSCRSYLDKWTPANVPSQAWSYVDKDPNDFGIFISLADARAIMREILTTRRNRLRDWKYELSKDKAAYQDAKTYLEPDIEDAVAAQEMFVGNENQPFSIIGMLTMSGLGGLGTLIGKNKMKRKGDLSPEEVEVEKSKAFDAGKNGGTI